MTTSIDAGSVRYYVDVDISGVRNPLDAIESRMAKTDDSARKLAKSFNLITAAMKAWAFAKSLQGLSNMITRYDEMNSRIRDSVDSQAEYDAVQRRLLASAQETYRSLGETQEAYIRVSQSMKAAGYETSQILDLTDSLSLGFVVNSTNAETAASAIREFGQASNKGRVDAQGWSTIINAVPTLLGHIATATGKTSKEILKLGAEGKLAVSDLNKGLAQALPTFRKQAANMAVSVVDASRNAMTGITMLFAELNEQSGALAAVSSAIDTVGKAISELASDPAKVATLLDSLTIAGASLAAVFAGKLLTSLYGYVSGQVSALNQTRLNIAATKQLIVIEQQAANGNLRRATAEKDAAMAALAKAKADTQAAAATAQASASSHIYTRALVLEAEAKATAMAASTGLAAAQARATAAAAAAVPTMNALRGSMAVLGGPAGVILLAAAGLWTFIQRSREAKVSTEQLAQAVETLGTNTLKLEKVNLAKDIAKFTRDAEKLTANIARTEKSISETGDRQTVFGGLRSEELLKEKERLDEIQASLNARIEREKEVNEELEKRNDINYTPGSTKPEDIPDTPVVNKAKEKELDRINKVIRGLEQELELNKLIGVERAKQDAQNQLNGLGSPDQIKRVRELGEEIYKLEQNSTTIESIKSLSSEIGILNLKGVELAQTKAVLSLGEYATPEQIELVKTMATELYKLNAVKSGSVAEVDPLVTAETRYQTELEQLKEYNDLKLIEDERYQQLRGQMEIAHAANMQALREQDYANQSKTNALLMGTLNDLQKTGGTVITGLLTGTSNLNDGIKQVATSIAGKAVQALVDMGMQTIKNSVIEKAAAASSVATAATTGPAIAAAYAPAAAAVNAATFGGGAMSGLTAMAASIPAMLAMFSMGGRKYGGGVQAGGLYKINEGNKPEILNSGDGNQYLLANRNGEVVSNSDATSGGGSSSTQINVHNYTGGRVSVNEREDEFRRRVVDIMIEQATDDGDGFLAMRSAIGAGRVGQ